MMRRSNPFDFNDIESMFERMSRQFDDMNRQLGSWDSGVGEMVSRGGMAIDVTEHDDSLVVVADLPGFEKEDIDLKIAGQVLTIKPDQTASGGARGVYQVKSGDNPFLIAKKHKMSLNRLLALNRLSENSRIFPGQKLIVE